MNLEFSCRISFLTKMEDFQIFVSIHKICLNFANQISNLKMELTILFSIVENLWTTPIMLGCGSKLTIFKFSFQYTRLAWIRVLLNMNFTIEFYMSFKGFRLCWTRWWGPFFISNFLSKISFVDPDSGNFLFRMEMLFMKL